MMTERRPLFWGGFARSQQEQAVPNYKEIVAQVFDFGSPGVFTSIAGLSHAKYEQHTQASRHVLAQMLAIIDHFGVEYYLFAGSLVGYVRNQSVPRWMDDLDILIFEDQIPCFEEKVLPYLKACGFGCYGVNGAAGAGYHVLGMWRRDWERKLNIALTPTQDVIVPWAQIDVFYTRVDEKGHIRNLNRWGLYDQKQIPVDWVKPGVIVEIDGAPRRVFSRYRDDIFKEYGDVLNNVVISTHHTTFLKAPNIPWGSFWDAFEETVAETTSPLPPAISQAQLRAYAPDPEARLRVPDQASYSEIIEAILRSNAGVVELPSDDHSYWVMDLRRLFPQINLEITLKTRLAAYRAAHLRAFISKVHVEDDELRAAYEQSKAALVAVLGA